MIEHKEARRALDANVVTIHLARDLVGRRALLAMYAHKQRVVNQPPSREKRRIRIERGEHAIAVRRGEELVAAPNSRHP